MTVYNAESFYRARISQWVTSSIVCPFNVRLSKLPVRTSWLLTISPNTEYEEIVEYNNPNSSTMEITIIKRGISPSSTLLTVSWTDYNNPTYMMPHTQNDIIRWDVNHIHINQWVGNSTLATEGGVGIVRLATSPVSPTDPVVIGDNDPRVSSSSTTNKGITRLSVAPVDANIPIAVGDNDIRLIPTDSTLSTSDITTNNVSTTKHWFVPKLPNSSDVFFNWIWGYSKTTPSWSISMYAWASAPTWWLLADGAAVSRTTYSELFSVVSTTYGSWDWSTTFNLPNFKWRVPVGRDVSQTEFDVLGETWGEKAHVLTVQEIPSHNHTTPHYSNTGLWNVIASWGGSYLWEAPTSFVGGWLAHNNIQPYLTINFIIKY